MLDVVIDPLVQNFVAATNASIHGQLVVGRKVHPRAQVCHRHRHHRDALNEIVAAALGAVVQVTFRKKMHDVLAKLFAVAGDIVALIFGQILQESS